MEIARVSNEAKDASKATKSGAARQRGYRARKSPGDR
jgi:hypothetical protein